jgi:hypothetical protein
MFSKRQSFICARTLALWIAVVAVMAGCGGGSSQTTSGQGNISVSVIGLPANSSVVLQNNGGNNLTVSTNGTSSFNGAYTIGLPYSITVLTQPQGATCTVTSNSSGVIPNAVVLVGVTCIPNTVNGTLIAPPPLSTPGNSTLIALDAGPVAGASQINIPYVSITVCPPGTLGASLACQTIDHVQLDTGSSGLRLLNSSLYANLSLPSVNASGPAIGECVPFAIGVTWGSVVFADIYLGGEVAKSVPIQIIGAQPGGVTAVPSDCSNTGTIQITQDALGANGILGVGLFANDCDICSTQVIPAAYYACTSAGCTNSIVAASQVVRNPVDALPVDNNGVVIQLPGVGPSGASALSGTLFFGIGTQTNNALVGTVYATDAFGTITTTYNGSIYTSFIDSGSNGVFFNDPTIALCASTTWYCPASPLSSLSAMNTAAIGTTTGNVSFSIVSLFQLSSGAVAANIGGTASGYFDWGLPFFFGRTVYTAIQGKQAPPGGTPGPYFAY